MANTNAPFGFLPFSPSEGPTPSFGLTDRKIAAAYGTKLFRGDPVISLTTGYIGIISPGVLQFNGIFWGCEYFNAAAKRPFWAEYWPAGSPTNGLDASAKVITDPTLCFIAQSTGTTRPLAFSDIGANIQVSLGTAGSTTTGLSGATIDDNTVNVTGTLPFRIVALYSQYAPPGTNGADDTSLYNWAVVRPNFTDRTSPVGI